MQFCPSFRIVQLMESGRSPQQACEEVVQIMKHESNVSFEVGVVAVNVSVSEIIKYLLTSICQPHSGI